MSYDGTPKEEFTWASAASELPPDLMAAVLTNEAKRTARREQPAPPPPYEPAYTPLPVAVEPPRQFSWRSSYDSYQVGRLRPIFGP